jgi:hypothetical protein
MTLALKVTTADGKEFPGPYLLRVSGWTEERYFAEAPESQFIEFEDGDLAGAIASALRARCTSTCQYTFGA